jgi:hypothetical protein
MEQKDHFEAWGIVDLFGHTRLAGRISEQTIGGETFIRVDVPNGPELDKFHTRLFGKGAIYGMSLTDEAIAREYAKRSTTRPVSAYDVPTLIADNPSPRALPPIHRGATEDENDDNIQF